MNQATPTAFSTFSFKFNSLSSCHDRPSCGVARLLDAVFAYISRRSPIRYWSKHFNNCRIPCVEGHRPSFTSSSRYTELHQNRLLASCLRSNNRCFSQYPIPLISPSSDCYLRAHLIYPALKTDSTSVSTFCIQNYRRGVAPPRLRIIERTTVPNLPPLVIAYWIWNCKKRFATPSYLTCHMDYEVISIDSNIHSITSISLIVSHSLVQTEL